MAFTIPNEADAFNADQAEPDKVDLDILVAGYINNGVINGCAVSAQGSPNMTVAVAAGQVCVDGYFPFIAAANVTITTAHSTNPRIDLICADYNAGLSAVAGTAAASPVLPAVPANNICLAAVYVPAADTTIENNQITDKRVFVLNRFDEQAEFNAGSTETGEIGELCWGATAAGTSNNSPITGTANHPGVLRLQTGTTSGNNSRIHPANSATTATLIPTDIARMRWIISPGTVTTSTIKLGFGVDLSVATAGALGSAGAWFEYDSATNANWRTVTRQASTSTTNTSSVAVTASNWYDLEMVRLQNGNWQFVINKTIVATHSANLPTTASLAGALVQTGTSAARIVDVDFYGANFKLGQRYT